MSHDLFVETLILICASGVAVAAFATLRMPATLGYLLAGLLLGPYALDLVQAGEDTRFLAELGLIFLMFTVGLEFSIPTIIAARRDVLLAGGLQVGVTALLVGGALALAGVGIEAAVILGGAVAMSSTAVSMKQLADQGEIGSRHGRLSVGILLFQDFATLPLLVLVDAWSRQATATPLDIMANMGIGALALAAAVFARPLIKAGFSGVLRTRSPDLFLLWVLAIAVGTAYAVHLAGLSPPVGAFVAGLIIGESEFRARVEEDIRPFRDVLVGLFFVTVGMTIDLSVVASHPLATLGWLLVFLLAKPIVILLVGLAAGAGREASARTAVILAHGGEFGLLLLTLALQFDLIPRALGQPVLVALVATMGIAPLLIQQNHRAGWLFGLRERRLAASEAALRSETDVYRDHIILCGCGRIGRLVAAVLEEADVRYVAVENDLQRYRTARRQGHKVVFADASQPRMLEAVGIGRARLVVVTFDRPRVVEDIVHLAKSSEALPATLVSTADDLEMTRLVRIEVTAVLPENLAAGLALADQALLLCGKSQEEAARAVNTVRSALNPELGESVGA